MTTEQAIKVITEVCELYFNTAKVDGLTISQVVKQVKVIQQALEVVKEALEKEKKLDKEKK